MTWPDRHWEPLVSRAMDYVWGALGYSTEAPEAVPEAEEEKEAPAAPAGQQEEPEQSSGPAEGEAPGDAYQNTVRAIPVRAGWARGRAVWCLSTRARRGGKSFGSKGAVSEGPI